MGYTAVFAGLVVDESGRAVEVRRVAGSAFYIVDDAGFERHIPTDYVDRQVLKAMQEQVMAHREITVEGMLQFMGQDDLFTKAMVEASIDKMDENMEQLLNTGLPQEARSWLGLMGLRVVIDFRGDVVELNMPEATETDE